MITKSGTGVLFLWGALSLFAAPVVAQSLATSARQLPKGSLKLLGYYQGTQSQETTFSVNGAANCVSPNGVSFGCSQTGDVTAKGTGGAGVVKFLHQPWEYVQYYAAIGVGYYSLQLPTGKMTGNPGHTGTLGLRGTIYPDTIVTPGIALDFGVTRADYQYNRFEQGIAGQSTDLGHRLGMWQYQFAVEIGHQFDVEGEWKIDPYGGVKWIVIKSDLRDLQTGGHSGGLQQTVSPFLGVRVPFGGHEAFFIEGSQFVDGTQGAIGLEFRF